MRRGFGSAVHGTAWSILKGCVEPVYRSSPIFGERRRDVSEADGDLQKGKRPTWQEAKSISTSAVS
jgi:hypothetical protein